MHIYIFFIVNIFFAPIISTSIYRRVNSSHHITVLIKGIETKTFNGGFASI